MAAAPAAPLKANLLWTAPLAASRGRIVAVATPRPDETVDTSVRILGDHSLLLKHLNPHLLAIAVVGASSSAQAASTLRVHLLDSVSGRSLFEQSHQFAAEPVRMIVSENWVVYSYWNTKAKRTEMAAVTLYEGSVDKKDLNLWSTPDCAPGCLEATRSSFAMTHGARPIALRQTFVYPAGIRTLSATRTARGITQVDLLLGLHTGQIMSLSRHFLDPRRPTGKPSDSEKKEKLMQYHPHLPFINQKMISYNQTVSHVRGIVSSPTRLESTSLVFSYGVDLFFARATPSNAFDRLPDTFNTFALVSLIVGLTIGVTVVRYLLARGRLHAAWA